jgi:DNA-binding response OmpR family regulator
MLSMIDEKQVGFSLGAADYFTKPVDWERLAASVAKHLNGAGGEILVVEDDATTRELLTRSLAKEGWKVREAENGRSGLERVAESVPSLVLLDLMMPELDGFEFMEGLRKMPGCRQLPVIVITARDITAEDRQRLNGEVARIVQKAALSPKELVDEIRALVARHAESVLD